MTVVELKAKAKELGLKGYSKLKKAELEELINKVNSEKKELSKEDLKEIVPPIVKIFSYENQEKWHELRGIGVGGSDIGAILGVNKYKSAIDVYIDKTEGNKNIGNRFTHFGHKLEKIVFEEFQERHKNMKCYTVPYTIQRGVCVANVDGMIYDPGKDRYGILELKTTSAYNKDEWTGDTVPQSYYAQVQHYLFVTGLSYAYIACLVGGNDYKEFYIERSLEDIDYLQEKATDFWKNHVEKRVPPMLDGSDSYSKYLLERADKDNKEVVELNELNTKAEEIKVLEEQMKSLEQQIKLKKQEIILELNNNHCNKAISTDYKFTISVQARSSVDKELMEKENPELVAQYKEVEKRYSVSKEIKFIKIGKNTKKNKEVA
ncbi:lambda-exonuclease family protein [Fusobacterium sp. SYSU M8D902]|uniref:lambda-exonuclease family protein n=1 Tax=Fusobacterium sp. SYSU M8D902 TaxID=3159562 RepID=UPI0032E51CD2